MAVLENGGAQAGFHYEKTGGTRPHIGPGYGEPLLKLVKNAPGTSYTYSDPNSSGYSFATPQATPRNNMAINPRTGILALGSYGGGTGTATAGYTPVPYTPPTFSADAYGKVPTATSIPKSIYDEAAAANPALFALDQKATGIIGTQLSGTLSPEEIRALQDNAAAFGVSNGVAGSGLQINGGLRTLGIEVGKRQQQGLGNYQNALKYLASMQLDPSLASGLETYNNQLTAAPDPVAAAAQNENLYQSHYAQQRQTQAYDAAAAEALYQTHYAQALRDQTPILPFQSGGVTYGGSSSMFKPEKTNTPFKSYPDATVSKAANDWGAKPGLYPFGNQNFTSVPGATNSGVIPDWNSGSVSSDPFTSGDFSGGGGGGFYAGENPNGPNPAGGTGNAWWENNYNGTGAADGWSPYTGDPYWQGPNYDPITDTYSDTPAAT